MTSSFSDMTSLDAAQAWCHAVLSGRANEAWHATEPGYCRAIAERLAQDGHALDDPAVAHAVLEQELPAEWRAYRDGEGELTQKWRDFAAENGLPEEGRLWSWLEAPRKVAPDCELVQVVDATALAPEGDIADQAPFQASEGAVLQGGLDLYMRRTPDGEWLLAGLNEFPPDWLQLDPE